jgi:cell division protein FtsI/penicillin-binding protein 2
MKAEKENKNNGKRMTLYMVILFVFLFIIYGKLFNIQVLNSARYKSAAKKQYESRISLKPLRGIIFDRKLNPLVSNVDMFSFAADPNMIDNRDSVASYFSEVFSKEKSYYLSKLEQQNTSFVWLERRVDPKYDSLLRNINFSGVIKINESHRIYNYDRTSSQIIGATDIDNEGISGIEYQFNKELSGNDGYVIMQKDGLGRKRPAVEYPRIEPKNGHNLVLTIDLNIQQVVEEELNNGVMLNDARGGKAVVMSVKTGEILGMYSLSKDTATDDYRTDRLGVITDLFEPGSTFKLVGAAGSLEESIENKTSIIQTQGGEYLVYNDKKITDSHKFGTMTFQQVIEQSSNVGMIQIANKLGEKRFFKYARDLGFGITTGIELPGEMKGILKRPIEFNPGTLKFMAIGYEVLVNTLQLVNAYSALANDGTLMKPFIIKKELNPDGSLIIENHPQKIRTVCSKQTAETMTDLLCGVVERGTGVDAKIENIKIAGKTGTSQKLVGGEYSKSSYTSSFIGFFPAEDPLIVIAVIIDSPSAGEYYGGKVSAPIFKSIAERLIAMNCMYEYNTQPEQQFAVNEKKDDDGRINLVDMDVNDAVTILNEQNIDYKIIGSRENCVVADQTVDEDNVIQLLTMNKIEKIKDGVIPDVTGLSLRKAVKTLSVYGYGFNIKGSGKVIRQEPAPGKTNQAIKVINLYCSENDSEISKLE